MLSNWGNGRMTNNFINRIATIVLNFAWTLFHEVSLKCWNGMKWGIISFNMLIFFLLLSARNLFNLIFILWDLTNFTQLNATCWHIFEMKLPPVHQVVYKMIIDSYTYMSSEEKENRNINYHKISICIFFPKIKRKKKKRKEKWEFKVIKNWEGGNSHWSRLKYIYGFEWTIWYWLRTAK